MKYTKIPSDTFQKIQLNAGVICTGFTPATGAVSGVLGATTGGLQFNAAPSFTDFGDDIDNCPKNMMELKKLDSIDVTLSGTLLTVDATGVKKLIGAADIDGSDATHIIPRRDVVVGDFQDIWWVGDYSDDNSEASGGYCAIHMMNTLNTGGFQIKSTDKGKGNFAFTFTGHVSMAAQDVVPYEVYIKGSGDLAPSIELDKKYITVTEATGEGHTAVLKAETVPDDATVAWTVGSSSIASISASTDTKSCTVTGVDAGNTIVTATITDDGVSYSDTCTVVVS